MPQVSGAAGSGRRRRADRPGPAAADGSRGADPAASRPGDVHRGTAGWPPGGSRCGWRWPGSRPIAAPRHDRAVRFSAGGRHTGSSPGSGRASGSTEARLGPRGSPWPRRAAAPGLAIGRAPARAADAHRGRRGRLGTGRPAGAARTHPRQQRVPPGSPGSGPAPRPAGGPGLRPGQGFSLADGRRAGHRGGALLARPAAAAGRPPLDEARLPGLHRSEPARRPRAGGSRADRAGARQPDPDHAPRDRPTTTARDRTATMVEHQDG